MGLRPNSVLWGHHGIKFEKPQENTAVYRRNSCNDQWKAKMNNWQTYRKVRAQSHGSKGAVPMIARLLFQILKQIKARHSLPFSFLELGLVALIVKKSCK